MTEREAEILDALKFTWMKPNQFGGFDCSHHSITARRMIPKGWVERCHLFVGEGRRGSYVYRITDKGAQALANHRALSRPRVLELVAKRPVA
jgi:DNA-binding MarR family transcriptional regulator